jgi:hypothetical protein
MAYIHLTITIKITGAEDRNRTGTVVTYRRILSPVRLPVPPPRHINMYTINYQTLNLNTCTTIKLLVPRTGIEPVR